MLSGTILSRALAVSAALVAAALASAAVAGPPAELPTLWEQPPGDPLEHETAGFAKILCSAIFISGRPPDRAKKDDGFFTAPATMRDKIAKTIIDPNAHEVRLTMMNGVTRSARLIGDQGCVTLPRGADSVFFTPVKVLPSLPDPAIRDWPMGDRLPDEPLLPEIDISKLNEAVATAFENPQAALTEAFAVVYKGRLIAERYEEGMDNKTRLAGWSMGKSITATLMGRLIEEGAYDLWQRAPVDEWRNADDPRHAIRIADLLHMSSGLRCVAPQDPDPIPGYPDHLYVYTGAIDSFHWSITRPPQWRPNTVWRYRNCDPLSVGYLIRKAVEARGENYLTWPQRDLFDKIGIRRMVLETDPYGNFLLNGYELGSARDWLRLGMLYLQGGVWNGERLLPEGWTDFVRTPAPTSSNQYGAFFWLAAGSPWPIPKDAYFMAGSGGQYTFIIPTHDLVVVRMGHDRGEATGSQNLFRALSLLMEAIPQVREPWIPPAAAP
jgi:CubicO group peptidase (beta-lactamase class C family)